MQKNPEVDPEIRTDDLYLTRWLHCKDWDVKGAFQRLMKQYKFQVSPEFLMFYISILYFMMTKEEEKLDLINFFL